MQLLTFTAAFLITFSGIAQAASCDTPAKIHKLLTVAGYSRFAFSMTDSRQLITIYTSQGPYVITIEDEQIACIVAQGKNLYISKDFDI